MSGITELLQTGLTHQQAGRLRKAEVAYREVLAQAPHNAHALHLLGVLAHQKGDNERAVELIGAAISKKPDIPDYYSNLGIALHDLGRLPEAERAHWQALRLKPDYVEALNNLGVVLTDRNDPEAAETVLRKAVRLAPEGVDAWNNLGITLRDQDRPAEAEAAYREALRLKPDFTEVWNNLGLTLRRQDRLREAEQTYREAIRLQSDYAGAWFNLALVKRFWDVADDDAVKMCKLLQNAGIGPEDQVYFHFGLGKIHDECGDQHEAFTHFREGNRIKRGLIDHDTDRSLAFVQRIMTVFNDSFLARWMGYGSFSQAPIFIVGLPRAGKTLAEQVLTGHPHIHGAGELLILPNRIVEKLINRTGSHKPFPGCARGMDGALAAELAAMYEKRLRRDAGPGIERVIDTLPTNFFRLGLIALLFPNARVIHCRRDPLDTCFAIYCKYFRRGNHYAYDFADIAAYYRAYASLMAHWREVLPLRMVEVDYEALVTDPERQARRLIDFIGLEWDPNCLGFHNLPAVAESRRQPLHDHEIGHWRYYEEFLDPLQEALDES